MKILRGVTEDLRVTQGLGKGFQNGDRSLPKVQMQKRLWSAPEEPGNSTSVFNNVGQRDRNK